MAEVVEITAEQFVALRELGAPVGYLSTIDKEAMKLQTIQYNWEFVSRNASTIGVDINKHGRDGRSYYTLIDSDGDTEWLG